MANKKDTFDRDYTNEQSPSETANNFERALTAIMNGDAVAERRHTDAIKDPNVKKMLDRASDDITAAIDEFIKPQQDENVRQKMAQFLAPEPNQKASSDQPGQSKENEQSKDAEKTSESLAAKKEAIFTALNKSIANNPSPEGIEAALAIAFKSIKTDPALAEDKDFHVGVMNAAKNLSPKGTEVSPYRFDGHNDNLFHITTNELKKKKFTRHLDKEKVESIVSKHLTDLYKHLGVAHCDERLGHNVKEIVDGRVPLHTQLSTRDSVDLLQKSRAENQELVNSQKKLFRAGHMNDYKEDLGIKLAPTMEKNHKFIKYHTGEGIQPNIKFHGTDTEKMNEIRGLITNIKAAELGIHSYSKDKAFEKAIHNLEQMEDKKALAIVKELQSSNQTDQDKFKAIASGYNLFLTGIDTKAHEKDIKTEITLLEKGKRPAGLDENLSEIKINATHANQLAAANSIAGEMIKQRMTVQYEKSRSTSRTHETTPGSTHHQHTTTLN